MKLKGIKVRCSWHVKSISSTCVSLMLYEGHVVWLYICLCLQHTQQCLCSTTDTCIAHITEQRLHAGDEHLIIATQAFWDVVSADDAALLMHFHLKVCIYARQHIQAENTADMILGCPALASCYSGTTICCNVTCHQFAFWQQRMFVMSTFAQLFMPLFVSVHPKTLDFAGCIVPAPNLETISPAHILRIIAANSISLYFQACCRSMPAR